MRTPRFLQTQQAETDTAQEAERRSPRETSPSARHAQWDELHGGSNGNTRHLLSNIRQGISQRPWTDIAVAATAGFALGWLMSNRQRSQTISDLFTGSLLPNASKKVHHAYDALRDSGALREIGSQFDKLKSRW